MLEHNLRRVRIWALTCAALAVLLLAVASCRSSKKEEPAPAGKVTLQTLDETEFGRILERYRGKVVLVDYWALWCVPCKKLFPHTVELYHELAGRGLAVISVSLDGLDNKAEVQEFLRAHEATFDNFIASHEPAEAAVLLGIESGIPHLRLFDRDGKLRGTFPPPQTAVEPAEIDAAVKELLER